MQTESSDVVKTEYTVTANEPIASRTELHPEGTEKLQPMPDVNEEAVRAERENTFAADSGHEMPSSKTAEVVPENAESVPDIKVENPVIPSATGTVLCKNLGSNALFVEIASD